MWSEDFRIVGVRAPCKVYRLIVKTILCTSQFLYQKKKVPYILCYLLCPRGFLQTKLFKVSDYLLMSYILEPLLSMSLRSINARSQVINYKWLLHANNDKPHNSKRYTFERAFCAYAKQFIYTKLKARSKLHVKSFHIHCASRNLK